MLLFFLWNIKYYMCYQLAYLYLVCPCQWSRSCKFKLWVFQDLKNIIYSRTFTGRKLSFFLKSNIWKKLVSNEWIASCPILPSFLTVLFFGSCQVVRIKSWVQRSINLIKTLFRQFHLSEITLCYSNGDQMMCKYVCWTYYEPYVALFNHLDVDFFLPNSCRRQINF